MQKVKLSNIKLGIDLFFSKNENTLLIKGAYGIINLKMPTKYYYKIKNNNNIYFLFYNVFYFKSFLAHFMYSCNYISIVYFVKFKMRGLGYKMRKITNSLFYFFYNYTNYYYFFLPFGLLMNIYKKRAILIGYNWQLLKLILSNILLLKKLGPYTMRGIRLVKQIILLKKSGKKV